MIQAVEDAMGISLSALAAPLPSYINRVYEFQSVEGERIIAKFYRPGRWSRDALKEEHDFVLGCAEEEIPVIAPVKLQDGETLGEKDGVFFAVYPKRSGRELEIRSDEDWLRIGRTIARVHAVGASSQAFARTDLHPLKSTAKDIEHLTGGGFVSRNSSGEFRNVCNQILDEITGLFDDVEFIRIHGDCHRGNILERPGEGIMIIDFDDMMIGPPIQDLWLLLPDHAVNCRYETDLLIEGYEQFRDFDWKSVCLIEPLRAMRIIYFLAWCSKQIDDFKFRNNFPDWGGDSFWRTEVADLQTQLRVIRDTKNASSASPQTEYVGRMLTDH
jgi:Ser/Thr protein kinase RdoA (MazF antagonist)